MPTKTKSTLEYTVGELKGDISKQMEIYHIILLILESKGECREVFHNLAEVLFDDRLGDS